MISRSATPALWHCVTKKKSVGVDQDACAKARGWIVAEMEQRGQADLLWDGQ